MIVPVHAYEITPDERFTGVNSIEAVRSRKVPGVRCPRCGVWALTGIIYPSVPLRLLDDAALPQDSGPISVAEFRKIAASLRAILGTERPLAPGADLGPLRGRATGLFGDFAWVNPWTPLLRESTWLGLLQEGLDLLGVRSDLKFRKESHEALFELEAVPKVRLMNPGGGESCEVCGRLPVKRQEILVLDASSFDASIALQRIAELPTILVANEAFVQSIAARGLSDIRFNPIQLS